MADRRSFMASILAAGFAPAFVRVDSLMGLYLPAEIGYSVTKTCLTGDVMNAVVQGIVVASFQIEKPGRYYFQSVRRNGVLQRIRLIERPTYPGERALWRS